MYPKVKVRASEQEDRLSPQNDRKAELFFTSPEFISMEAKENRSSSPLPIVRILKAHALEEHSTKQLSSASKVENNRRPLVKDAKPNVRACSVPRPRAVLSSPDNDGMIGSRNELINERRSALKTHNTREEKGPAQTKLIPISQVKSVKPLNMAKTSEKTFKSKSGQKQRKFQEPIKRSQKASLGIGKSTLV
ncbi:uncharacterized protein LOC21398946 [Morus notabilis]|nr:uncharacterized protein LOC21398946 [Morus notabilis]